MSWSASTTRTSRIAVETVANADPLLPFTRTETNQSLGRLLRFVRSSLPFLISKEMSAMTAIPISLSKANRKVGRVMSFSLPALVTCPGASLWCRKHCYALRMGAYRPNCRGAYDRNFSLTRDPERFVRTMLECLPADLAGMRIHVSGDFHSQAYLEAWWSVCAARAETLFWGYSRSWTVPHLLPALDRLRSLPNVQIFASLDATMPSPPEGWRVAFVESDVRAYGLPCRQQHGQEASCLACGHCFRRNRGHVVFNVH